MNANRRAVFAAALLVAAAGCSKKSEPPQPVRVITTPEIAATGIVQRLGDVFGSQSARRVEVRAVASAAIVAEAKRGTAAIVIVNDPDAVRALDDAQMARLQSVFANDDFLIVGPRGDPARVRTASSAPEAFRRIFRKRRSFCSAAAFHDREQRIWSAAGLDPAKNRHYRQCQGDAAAALNEAGRAGAYALTDRATWDAAQPRYIATLLRHATMLNNDLTIVLLKREKDAEWFVEWVMSYRGRDAVDTYRVNGQKRFYIER